MTEPLHAPPAAGGTIPLLRQVVCGVDGTPDALVAAQQAARLAGPDGHVRFVCVRSPTGFGRRYVGAMGEQQAADALREPLARASAVGVPASADVVVSDEPPGAVLADEAAASAADLVVTGAHAGSRVSGMVLGSTASRLAHDVPCPLLLSRRPPGDLPFPRRIVVASDGSDHAARAVALAGALAREHGSDIWLLGVDGHGLAHRLGEHTALLASILGRPPLALQRNGAATDEIVAAAGAARASLLVLGARGLTGVRALGSVSERVAHTARCSVLIARV